MGNSGATRAAFAALCFGAASHAYAQEAGPATPPAVAGGRMVIDPTQRLAPPQPGQAAPARPPISLACPFAGSDATVTLRRVVVERSTVVSPTEVDHAVAALTGQPRRLDVLCEARDRVAALFERKGFRLIRIDIPAQSVREGEFRLIATEGYIANENLVLGPLGPSKDLAAGYFARPKTMKPTPWPAIERAALLARDIPGSQINVDLHSGTEGPGAVDLEAIAAPRDRFYFTTGYQHLGAEELGRDALFARFDANGFTRFGEQTSLVVFGALNGAQEVVRLSEDLRLGSSGLSGGFDISYAKTNPKGQLAPLNLDGDALLATLRARYPLIRSQQVNLFVQGGMEFVDQKNTLGVFGSGGNTPTLFDDHLRILSAALTGGWRPASVPGFSLNGQVEFRHGIEGIGSSRAGDLNLSRAQGRPDAFVVRGAVAARWNIGQPAGTGELFTAPFLSAQFVGQYADSPLLAYEEYQIGNYTIGRGYDPGAASGDRAYGGSIEAGVRIAIPPPFHNGPFARDPVWVEPYAFYDAVRVENLDVQGYSSDVHSYGAGLRALLPGRLRLDLAYARAVDPPFPNAARPRGEFLATLSCVFALR